MASIDDYFGTYLKTEDIKKEMDVTIKEVTPEEVGKGDQQKEKLVVYFEELDKGLTLNKINSEAIAEITDTRDFETWSGYKLCLYVDKNVMFGGKRVGGIRVKPTQDA